MAVMLVILAAVFLAMVSGTSLVVVRTEAGLVEGENIQTDSGRYMDVFQIVPVADIPGRFEKPKHHPGWDGVFNAMENVKECLQMQLFVNGTTGSEDCLYLNIWVPHGSSVSKDLAVMVWIYGGGFTYGNSIGHFSDANLYNGQQMAERGNVIMVSVGYRVGTLGFLSTGDSSLPGNYGLWDQQTAIAWVHRNILSAGGASVSLQTLTPHNRGLIRRAISRSGVALCSWAVHRNTRSVTEEVALRVNCPTDHNMASCLKTIDPEKLTMAGVFDQTSSPDARTFFTLPSLNSHTDTVLKFLPGHIEGMFCPLFSEGKQIPACSLVPDDTKHHIYLMSCQPLATNQLKALLIIGTDILQFSDFRSCYFSDSYFQNYVKNVLFWL
uniref:Carboxylesterase type B domain-containing protein n=1 Tax=Acanthochromis polyacanthus TaxID=80966 RepID=A0A3Q1GTY2_9TELE